MVLHNKKIFQTVAKAYKQHVTQYKVFWRGDGWRVEGMAAPGRDTDHTPAVPDWLSGTMWTWRGLDADL